MQVVLFGSPAFQISASFLGGLFGILILVGLWIADLLSIVSKGVTVLGVAGSLRDGGQFH
jgi:hypothetical protein